MKILDELDGFFNQQKEQEQKVFMFLPVLLFGFLSYYFVYPITEEALNMAIDENKKLEKKITELETNNMALENGNSRLIKTIKNEDKILKKLNENKIEIDKLLKKLFFLKFDLVKWAEFYDEIPALAKKNRLTVLKLDNEIPMENKELLVQEKMYLTIVVTGNFIDFIRFINEFEKKKELIKVRSLQIKKNEMTVSFDIYGAEL